MDAFSMPAPRRQPTFIPEEPTQRPVDRCLSDQIVPGPFPLIGVKDAEEWAAAVVEQVRDRAFLVLRMSLQLGGQNLDLGQQVVRIDNLRRRGDFVENRNAKCGGR